MTDAPASVAAIVVYVKATGVMRYVAPATAKPADTTLGWTALPSGYDPASFSWNATTKAMVEDVAKVEAQLIAAIKAESEQRKMVLLSVGGAKKAEYAEKRQEVVSYDTLATGVGGIVQQLTTLSTPRRQVMLAHATADAAAHGDTVAAAIERFRAGINRAGNTAMIAAAEAAACDAIRAAITIAAKKTAASKVKWP